MEIISFFLMTKARRETHLKIAAIAPPMHARYRSEAVKGDSRGRGNYSCSAHPLLRSCVPLTPPGECTSTVNNLNAKVGLVRRRIMKQAV